jgi:hypothetical protein
MAPIRAARLDIARPHHASREVARQRERTGVRVLGVSPLLGIIYEIDRNNRGVVEVQHPAPRDRAAPRIASRILDAVRGVTDGKAPVEGQRESIWDRPTQERGLALLRAMGVVTLLGQHVVVALGESRHLEEPARLERILTRVGDMRETAGWGHTLLEVRKTVTSDAIGPDRMIEVVLQEFAEKHLGRRHAGTPMC